MLISGHISSGSDVTFKVPPGFGIKSMNLLSPVWPQRSGLLPWAGGIINATGMQYEGFNYLGIGVLMLCAIHLVSSRRNIARAIKRNIFLFIALIGFTLFALSNKIYFGDHLIFSFPLPYSIDRIVSPIRSSGRFFWPVTYVIMTGVIVLTLRRFRRSVAFLLLFFAVSFQLLDTIPLRSYMSREFKKTNSEAEVLNRAAWDTLIDLHDIVRVFPSFQCREWDPKHLRYFDEMLQSIAAKKNVRINSAYVAQGRSVQDCPREHEEAVALKPRPKELYVFFSDYYSMSVGHRIFGNNECRRFKQGYVCTQSWEELAKSSALSTLSTFEALESPVYYHIGSEIDFGIHGNIQDYKAGGWKLAEPWGSRLHHKKAFLELPLAESVKQPLTMSVTVNPSQVPITYSAVNVEVIVNKVLIGEWQFDPRKRQTLKTDIPTDVTSGIDRLIIQFGSDKPLTVRSVTIQAKQANRIPDLR